MKHLKIISSPVELRLLDFGLKGDLIVNQTRFIKDMAGIFQDVETFYKLDPELPVYTVQAWLPVKEGTEGGLFFGTSTIFPGKVNQEYFMTKGHFHEKSDRAEFYLGVQGTGMLILMDRARNTWAEEVFPGSLHYIDGDIAHRLANTGRDNLIVGACWPSDAGHDYEEISLTGFSARLIDVGEKAVLVEMN
ncbi:MAG: glucose-6-phosphate isomerase [Porphyromonadaceae bacterium]|nr:MAG: glucose-6-phosphate isomerase [Porphyromonadaceae bacterium]